MSAKVRICISSFVHLPAASEWDLWNGPEHIECWNAASDDRHAPRVEVDLRVGDSPSFLTLINTYKSLITNN